VKHWPDGCVQLFHEEKLKMENVMAPAAPVEKVHHPGLGFKGLWQVFVAPSQLFAKVKEDPKVLVPYIVLGLAILGLMLLLADYILQAQMQSEQFQKSLEQRGVTREQLTGQVLTFMKLSTVAAGTLGMLLVPLLIAALAAFWGKFVFAGRASFKALLSVSLFGEVLYALGSYVTIPLVMAKKSILVSLSAAALLPNPDLTSLSYALLSKISLFHIWELIVLGIGFSIILGLPRNKGIWVAVLSMGLLAILHALSSGIGAMFA